MLPRPVPCPPAGPPEEQHEALLQRLARGLPTGPFTLASGRQSEHYVNCKPVSLSGQGLALISTAMLAHVEEDAAAVAGLTLGADPLVSGVAMAAALRQASRCSDRAQTGQGSWNWRLAGGSPAGDRATGDRSRRRGDHRRLVAQSGASASGRRLPRAAGGHHRGSRGGGAAAMKSAGLELISLFRCRRSPDAPWS